MLGSLGVMVFCSSPFLQAFATSPWASRRSASFMRIGGGGGSSVFTDGRGDRCGLGSGGRALGAGPAASPGGSLGAGSAAT